MIRDMAGTGTEPHISYCTWSEELGEISRRILRFEGYKIEKFDQRELARELTDLLYLTLKLANKFKIDLDKEWNSMWKRYEKKTSRK